MTPCEALKAIDGLDKFGIVLGLERTSACLEALGAPHRRYPTVHVGGTNGKGSTSALLAAAFSAAGYRTGLYTSPPLEFFGERIQVDGRPLPEDEVPALLEAVLAVERARPGAQGLTQFEVITAMAFLHFARAGVDVAVVEVGLGGRLDATNVIAPEVAVITNVGLEHADHLGPTVARVAREKGGIVKPGAPLVTCAEGEALEVLREVAEGVGAPVYEWGRDFTAVREASGGVRFRGRRWDLPGLGLALLGDHQRFNLGAALAALEVLEEKGWRLPEAAVRRGVAHARWPGRLEVLGTGPRVVLDGAHNPHASRVLARALRDDLAYDRLRLVLGILGDKDARSIVADLAPLAHEVVVTRSGSARALDLPEIEALVRCAGAQRVEVSPSVATAVDRCLERAGPGDLVCVTGSLTTVGEARSHLRRLRWVP
ncbi:MAG: folylpolyglutamate synthase/dihydrofolate synthase family protein [Deferrisomatales bacterium]